MNFENGPHTSLDTPNADLVTGMNHLHFSAEETFLFQFQIVISTSDGQYLVNKNINGISLWKCYLLKKGTRS